MSRYVGSKWKKTQALITDPKVAPYVPITKVMNHGSLRSMLFKFGMVYIKPDYGMHGVGVMRVEKRSGAVPFCYRTGLITRTFSTFDKMYDDIVRMTRGKMYLVQWGIHLRQYGGRSFDLRVLVQCSPQKQWETTGIIGRVAHPRKVVTNYHNGGTLVLVERLLGAYLPASESARHTNQLKTLGVQVAQQLSKKFPGIKMIGLDIGLDEKLRPWIIEVNTAPDIYIFRKLKDKKDFWKILGYARAYRRIQ